MGILERWSASGTTRKNGSASRRNLGDAHHTLQLVKAQAGIFLDVAAS